MSGIYQLFGGGGSGSASVDGNGYVVNADGLLIGREILSYGAVVVENGDGRGGPLRIGVEPTLGKLIGASGTITTDQPIPIYGADQYIVDKIVICHSTAVPVEMRGGFYTGLNKGGDAIVTATQLYTGLGDDATSILVLTPTAALRSAPYIYLSLTTANGSPVTFDVLVYGTIIIPNEV
jgi:hypothetical protein